MFPSGTKRIAAFLALAMVGVILVYWLERGESTENDTMRYDSSDDIEMLRIQVVERYPHARDAFTQGLVWHDNMLYESTGQYGASTLRLVDLLSGQLHRRVDLDAEFFGEGLARVGDRLIQLTWHEGKALVYRLDNFEKVAEFDYQGEGWGLCYDGQKLFMSDGSAFLTVRHPETFAQQGRIQVTIRGRPQAGLNELECVDGLIYANVWQYDQILRIDKNTGRVTALIEGAGLLDESVRHTVDVLNGIAYMPERKRFLITGKYWPFIFEASFVSAK